MLLKLTDKATDSFLKLLGFQTFEELDNHPGKGNLDLDIFDKKSTLRVKVEIFEDGSFNNNKYGVPINYAWIMENDNGKWVFFFHDYEEGKEYSFMDDLEFITDTVYELTVNELVIAMDDRFF